MENRVEGGPENGWPDGDVFMAEHSLALSHPNPSPEVSGGISETVAVRAHIHHDQSSLGMHVGDPADQLERCPRFHAIHMDPRSLRAALHTSRL